MHWVKLTSRLTMKKHFWMFDLAFCHTRDLTTSQRPNLSNAILSKLLRKWFVTINYGRKRTCMHLVSFAKRQFHCQKTKHNAIYWASIKSIRLCSLYFNWNMTEGSIQQAKEMIGSDFWDTHFCCFTSFRHHSFISLHGFSYEVLTFFIYSRRISASYSVRKRPSS